MNAGEDEIDTFLDFPYYTRLSKSVCERIFQAIIDASNIGAEIITSDDGWFEIVQKYKDTKPVRYAIFDLIDDDEFNLKNLNDWEKIINYYRSQSKRKKRS